MAAVAEFPKRPTAKERLAPLTEIAESVFVDNSQSITRYYISSKQLYETANYEANHGNHQKAYILTMRFLDLFVERIPKHPKYLSLPEDQVKSVISLCKKALDLATDLKRKVLAEFEEEIKLEEEEELTRHRALQQKEEKSGDLDGLVDRINRLNAAMNDPSGRPENSSWPSFPDVQEGSSEGHQSAVNHGKAWPANVTGPGIGTEAWPSNVTLDSPNAQPMVDRSSKPRAPPRRRIPSEALREVRLPVDLVSRFAQAAKENTAEKNIETCGNLWGVRESGSYVVTHVLIPKQKATDSYCEDLDEGTVAEFAITRDLIQLGWIHTHPSQTAFLSSVDLHMQHGYQIMLPEAIAIVLAPTFDDVGIFRLSNFGMEVVAQCRQGATFHVHDEHQPLFERVDDAVLDDSLAINLEDFRSD